MNSRKSSSVSLKVSCDQERQQRKNPPVPPPKVLYDQARQQRKSSLPSALDRNTNRGNLMNGRSQNAPMSRGGAYTGQYRAVHTQGSAYTGHVD